MSDKLISKEIDQAINLLEDWSKELIIFSKDDRDFADSNLSEVGKQIKAVQAYFKDSKDKARSAWKAICDMESSFIDKLETIKSNVKRAIQAFDIEEQKKREAERLRLQAIADEQARKERERLEKQAAKVKSPEKAEALLEQAAMVESAPVQIAEDQKPKGSSYLKVVWGARVVDFKALPDEYKLANESLLDKIAKSTKGAITVPGVQFYDEKTLVSGRS